MRSTTLSCLVILGLKKCMLCYLPMYGGPKREFFVSQSLSFVRVFQHAKDSTQAPPGLLEPLPISERRFGSWLMSFITGLPSRANGCNAIFTCVDRLTKYTVLTACTLGAGELGAKQVAQLFFLGCCQTVWSA